MSDRFSIWQAITIAVGIFIGAIAINAFLIPTATLRLDSPIIQLLGYDQEYSELNNQYTTTLAELEKIKGTDLYKENQKLSVELNKKRTTPFLAFLGWLLVVFVSVALTYFVINKTQTNMITEMDGKLSHVFTAVRSGISDKQKINEIKKVVEGY